MFTPFFSHRQPRRTLLQLALLSSFGAVSVILAGCASFDGIQSHAQLPASTLSPATAEQLKRWPGQDWASQIGGADLQSLIAQALQNSPNLAVAAARIDAARAGAEFARADRKLSADLGYDATYQRFSENSIYPPPFGGAYYTDNEAALKVKYDLDFWGKHSAEIRASVSQEKAAVAELQTARLMLSTAIAESWVQLARQYAMQDIARQQLVIREHIDELTKKRIAAGLDTESDKQQARFQTSSLKLELAQWDEAIALSRNQLAALTGQQPEAGQTLPKPGALATVNLPSELSLDLLSRRPDIVASRWLVEANQGEVDASKTQFYPNINLIGFAGLSTLSTPVFNNFISSGSVVAGFGPSIHLPIFESGRLRSQLKSKVASYDAAVATYHQTLIDAMHDTADQLSSLQSVQTQLTQSAVSESAQRKSLELARLRQQAGTANALPVLYAESNLLAQQKQILELQFRRSGLQVKLIKALGGGFNSTEPSTQFASQPTFKSESAL